MAELPRHVSALSPLDEAIDGTPKSKPRRPRSAPVLREVISGIVCFCGERFSEGQALEFMLHLRAEVGDTLSWAAHQRELKRASVRRYRQRNIDKIQEYEKKRMQDPETRARKLAYLRAYGARRRREGT